MGAVVTRSLDPILRGVSRSIFLSFRVAPKALRRQLGLGYLFCRAADTIADTRLLPLSRRLDDLRRLRAQFEAEAHDAAEVARVVSEVVGPQAIPEEKELLLRLAECFEALRALGAGDQALLRRLVTTLTRGMETDLECFPSEESGRCAAIADDVALDRYTYYVAGCVGEFWTELQCAHIRALSRWDLPAMREKGVRFGKGLQMTNILRDIDRDLAIGRCYIPRSRLEPAAIRVEDLQRGEGRGRLRPIVAEYLGLTLDHYRAGWEYTLLIPRRVPRLRLACAWPLLIGLGTLALLAEAPDPCAPGVVLRVAQGDVNRMLVLTALRVFSNRGLHGIYRRLEARVAGALARSGSPR